MSQHPYVVVIGGANVDIAGRPSGQLVQGDSNVGSVRLSHGGVGRNIAHNLALLGVDVRLVTAFGQDAQATSLVEGCRAAGIDVSDSIVVDGGSTSTYLFVMDEAGEMQVAINDMAILEHLTRERLAERLDLMRGAAICFVDTNVPKGTVRWACEHLDVPLFCDPISGAKAARLQGVVGRLHTLKPNRLEAEALTGVHIHDEASLAHAARLLLDTGLGHVFISLGAEGAYCADHEQSALLPPVPARLQNATGAGDAMSAALAWAQLEGMGLVESCRAGLAAASVAVEGPDTINERLSANEVRRRMAVR